MTSKERSEFRAKAHHLRPIYSIGKEGVTDEFISSVDIAIETHELIKINILQNCDLEPNEAAELLSKGTRSEVIQIVGKKITLYRKSHAKKEKGTAPVADDKKPSRFSKSKKAYVKPPKPRQKSTKR